MESLILNNLKHQVLKPFLSSDVSTKTFVSVSCEFIDHGLFFFRLMGEGWWITAYFRSLVGPNMKKPMRLTCLNVQTHFCVPLDVKTEILLRPPHNLVVESNCIGESEIMCIKPEEEGGQGRLSKFNSHFAELPDLCLSPT